MDCGRHASCLHAFGDVSAAGSVVLGFIGELPYEAIEEIDKSQVEAVSATGASSGQVMDYAIVPQVLPDEVRRIASRDRLSRFCHATVTKAPYRSRSGNALPAVMHSCAKDGS